MSLFLEVESFFFIQEDKCWMKKLSGNILVDIGNLLKDTAQVKKKKHRKNFNFTPLKHNFLTLICILQCSCLVLIDDEFIFCS